VTGRIVIERIPALFASIYEKATRMVIETYYRGVAEEVVSAFKSGLLLDLGTGPGYLPLEIVKRSPEIRITGIDLSGKLIRMAQSNALKAGVSDKVSFEAGNAAKLRFQDNSFDMVISTGMLHMLKNPVRVLEECYRVVKPGGEVWIYDPARVGSQINVKKWKASFSAKEKLAYRLFTLYSRIHPPRTYDPEEIKEMVHTAGFKQYRIRKEGREVEIKLRR